MSLRPSPLHAVHAALGARALPDAEGGLPAAFGPGPEAALAEAAATRTGAGLYDLSGHGVVTLVGPDARRFCNGMFTNNVRDLAVGHGNASAMVDDRARIQGLLRLYATAPDAFLAVLEGVSPEAFEARYGRYIIFDDVELTDVSDALTVISVQGPGADAVIRAAGLAVPDGDDTLVEADGVRVATHRRCLAGGFDLVLPREAAVATWEALRAAGGRPVGVEAQEMVRIEAGLPRWPVDASERSLLHELRLVPTHASFNKGCYIGQEVINRIDVMGQVTKKLWGLELEGGAVPPAGAEVRLGEEPVGVTHSGVREGGRVRVLALLRRAAWQDGLVVRVVAGDDAWDATVRDLPFP